MIEILYIENKEQLSTEFINYVERLIGPFEKNKASRYRRSQDRQAYLLGKALLARHLENSGYSSKLLKNLSYTMFNRPFIECIKGDFNVSHSGRFVICAFSITAGVGVDIEKIQPVNYSDFNNILNADDKNTIKNSPDRNHAFFNIWSAKEAILKADGCGLVDDIHKLEIHSNKGIFNKNIYYLKELDIDPLYSACIASSSPIKNFNLKKVSLTDFLPNF